LLLIFTDNFFSEAKAESNETKSEAAPANDKKRAREDDGEGNTAKKVDVKPAVTADAS